MKLVGISAGAFERKLKAIHLVIITAAIFAVYLNSIGGGFVGDDNGFIETNLAIRDLGNIPDFFIASKTLAGYDADWGTIIYRPLRTLSYAFDYALWGLNPAGYHITSIILHALVSITLYFLISRLLKIPTVAFLGSLVFALHPVHIEAVAWISSRADLIGMLFLNLTLLAYIRYRSGGPSAYLALALVLSFIAYLGKETMVSLPAVIVLYDYASQKGKGIKDLLRSNFVSWALFSIVCAAYLVFRFQMTGRMSTTQGWWGGTVASNFLMMAKATAVYIRLIVLPVKLNLHYLIKPAYSPFDPWVLVSLITILFTLSAAVYFHFKNRMAAFFIAWFYAGLVPIANIVPISFSMMAERYIYMPSAGPIIAMCYGFYLLHEEAARRGRASAKEATAVLIAVLIAFSAGVVVRNRVYADEFAFYTAAVEGSPESAPSLKGLADQYHQRKDYGKAVFYYEKAISIDPYYAEAFAAQSALYQELGEPSRSLSLAIKAVEIKPENAVIRFHLGNAYKDIGDMERARSQWEKVLELNPDYSEAYNNLGIYYQLRKDYGGAVRMFEMSLKVNPYNAETYYNLALLFEAKGDSNGARVNFLKFIELAGPEYAGTVKEVKKRF